MTAPLVMWAGTNPFGLDRPTIRQAHAAVRRYHQVRESAPATEAPTRTVVREASVGGTRTAGPGRMLLRLITAGWSLNGNHYGAEVLRKAATDKAWPKGTRCYVDHASDDEEAAHPSGSVKNLAAVLTEDARWDDNSQSLVAEARLFEPWRGPLSEMADADAIGMSIRAWVTGQHGERDGREGFIVDWVEGRSVDFVTVPAAGGAVISVLEAVGNPQPAAEAATLGAWLESRLHLALTQYADDMYGDGRLTRPERLVLSSAIGDGLQAWAARVEADAPQLFQRTRWEEPAEPVVADTAEASPDTASRDPGRDTAGESVEDGTPPPPPNPQTDEEEPVSGLQTGAPPEQAGTATVPDNGHQPVTTEPAPQITAEAIATIVAGAIAEATAPLQARLEEFASRDQAREAENLAARNRQAAADAAALALQAIEHVDVATSISSRVVARVTSAVPTTAEGTVDDSRLTELVTAVIADEATHVRRERANALAEAGVGVPYGMGGSAAVQEATDDGLEDKLEKLFVNLNMTSEAAKIAAQGRVS